MNSAETVRTALAHRDPGRVPVDFGSTFVSGIHVTCVAALRRHYGLGDAPVRVIDPGQMLGEVDERLKQAMGIDVEGVVRRMTRFGFPAEDWKPWRLPGGLEVVVPGQFNPTLDAIGDVYLYPQGDQSAPPCARMPKGVLFFDNIERQPPIDEARLNPEDNLAEYGPISEAELAHLENSVRHAAQTGRAVIASFGGTGFGDVSFVPGPGLKHPRGIREVTEWYVSIRARPDYIRHVFERQCEIAIANLERIAARVGGCVDIINVCGTDFGTQTSSFCSVATFRDLWMPCYRRVNDWVHRHTAWKTFKHSCGSVQKFIPSFIECGFDILNPVQCSAANMGAEHLKEIYGDKIVLWGGGVDTQSVLPFGTPAEVREQVLRRCDVFSRAGGFVFNAVHNIQAGTPVENMVAMIDAVREFNGRR